MDFLWNLKRRLLNSSRVDFPLAHPLISGDDFRNCCHFVFDDLGLTFLPSKVFENALVFVKAYPPLVNYFFRQIHPRIRKPYRLVTHNGDYSLPGEHQTRLEDPKLLHWYTTNLTWVHPKATAVPIGILNQRARSNNLTDLMRLMENPPAKRDLSYLNFHIGGDKERAEYRAHRQSIYDRFSGCSWMTRAERVSPGQYLQDIASHRFVISPPGHGPDCYRHWEAMYLGAIPIVERSVSMQSFDDYPMIQVSDWSEVTPEFLQVKAEEIYSRPFDRSKLFFDYWKTLLAPCR